MQDLYNIDLDVYEQVKYIIVNSIKSYKYNIDQLQDIKNIININDL